jgi:hypothetical protein
MFPADPFEPSIFSFFAAVIPVIVIGGFIFIIGRGLVTYFSNNASHVLVEYAKVISKRTQIYGGGESNGRTAYFVTFELDSNGERVELQVSGRESGKLVEGDIGELTFQGTRYKGFTRSLSN